MSLAVDQRAGYSATGARDYLRIRAARSAWPSATINQDVLDRASDVQGLLAARSQHRGAAIADLIIAAVAEAADLVVLHYDADFDLIAAVTGQSTEWVVAAGLAD